MILTRIGSNNEPGIIVFYPNAVIDVNYLTSRLYLGVLQKGKLLFAEAFQQA